MPDPVTGITAGVGVIGGILNRNVQKKAAEGASRAEVEAAEKGIAEQRRQFDVVQGLLKPYVEAGNRAIERQEVLSGLRGPEAQAEAFKQIEESPGFESIVKTGEKGILASASATGGLRGGDVQRVMGEFRPNILNELIEREFSRLGGLSATGQASAAGEAALATRTGESVTRLITEQGESRSQNIIAQGQADVDFFGNIGKTVGIIAGGF